LEKPKFGPLHELRWFSLHCEATVLLYAFPL
jgi:hypothetical protein